MKKLPCSVSFVALVVVGYLVTIFVVHGAWDIFSSLADVAAALPVLLSASLVAYALRALRWLFLLAAFGHSVPTLEGILAYVAGFALTASPGKAGELVRIRYFGRYGVPASHVVATFVLERALDLVALLVFASLLVGNAAGLSLAFIFVSLVLAAVAATARWPRIRYRIQLMLRRLGLCLIARWVRIVLSGVEQTARFLSARWLIPGVVLGLIAWGVQCIGYALTFSALGITLPWWVMFAIPPATILIGAASMLPGGIGTTEVATVVLLAHFGIALDIAILASIALRLGSIWFATLLGLAAMAWFELRTP